MDNPQCVLLILFPTLFATVEGVGGVEGGKEQEGKEMGLGAKQLQLRSLEPWGDKG